MDDMLDKVIFELKSEGRKKQSNAEIWIMEYFGFGNSSYKSPEIEKILGGYSKSSIEGIEESRDHEIPISPSIDLDFIPG